MKPRTKELVEIGGAIAGGLALLGAGYYELAVKKPAGALVGKQVNVNAGKITITSGSQFVVAPPADALATIAVSADDGTTAKGTLLMVSSVSGKSSFTPPTPTICSFPSGAVNT